MHIIKGYKDEWRIQEYLLITFFISWLSWGILILLTAFHVVEFMSPLGILLFGIGGFGPTFSALLCIEGKLTWKKFLDFVFSHKKRTVLYLLIFIILEILSVALSSMEVNPEMPWYTLPIVFLVCTLVGGGNEELGWRGTLQPLLNRLAESKTNSKFLSFFAPALVVGVIWAIWHLPLWFVAGSTQQGINFGLFALSTILLAFWLACIYVKTKSVFYCMLLHGLSNVLFSFFAVKINWILIIGFTIMTVLSVILGAQTTAPSKTGKAR